MPQLLIELFSEEIPARMQAGAARDFARLFAAELSAHGLQAERLETYCGPRRLTLVAEGLPAVKPDRTEERKGPKTNAPEAALSGFLRSTGLSKDELVERDGVYFAEIKIPGGPTAPILTEALAKVMTNFPWPKSMRSGVQSFRWVRPLKSVLFLFDGEVPPFEIAGVVAGRSTRGHRVLSDGQPFEVEGFAAYAQGLRDRFVILTAEERKAVVLERARAVCLEPGLELVEDEGLLDEVSGLAEWPVPLLGDMDPSFLSLPPEVIRTSMRTHQKYFAVRDPKTGGLAAKFVVTANVEPKDGGAEIKRGNAKVLSARLSDAKFFYSEDQKPGAFEVWLEKLKGVTFHAKLGTMAERVERIAGLAAILAPTLDADPAVAVQAARLSKADLASGMVGEFPELQGVMGGYYARAAYGDVIADAVRDHYRPQGPSDSTPTAPVSVVVALADKLDTLMSFFGIDEKPTGSKDPFALRRAALGVIRLLLVNRIRLPLASLFAAQSAELLPFFIDRLKVQLRDEGKRHDLIDAAVQGDDDLVRIVERVEALEAFLTTDDGANLLAGYRRAANILKAEEKKGELPSGHVHKVASAPKEELELIDAYETVSPQVIAAVHKNQFADALTALSSLRIPVDAFFEKVLVNSGVEIERRNRLLLAAAVRDLMNQVADFSKITT